MKGLRGETGQPVTLRRPEVYCQHTEEKLMQSINESHGWDNVKNTGESEWLRPQTVASYSELHQEGGVNHINGPLPSYSPFTLMA